MQKRRLEEGQGFVSCQRLVFFFLVMSSDVLAALLTGLGCRDSGLVLAAYGRAFLHAWIADREF